MKATAIRYLYLFILLVLHLPLCAQPGGGGGIDIGDVYMIQLQQDIRIDSDDSESVRQYERSPKTIYRIDSDDPSFRLRLFALQDTSFMAPVFEEIYQGKHKPWGALHGKYSVAPGGSFHWQSPKRDYSHQRLLLEFRGQIMIIDIYDVMPENGMGHIDRMDSIVFMPGYFRLFKNIYKQGLTNEQEMKARGIHPDSLRLCLQHGLSPTTLPLLLQYHLAEYYPSAEGAWLREERLPAFFFRQRAFQEFEQGDTTSALVDIRRALGLGLEGEEKTVALQLHSRILSAIGLQSAAIDTLTKALEEFTPDNPAYAEQAEREVASMIARRAELHISMKNYNKAKADYDRIVALASYPASAVQQRAWFKMKHLHNYAAAGKDIRTLLDSFPPNPREQNKRIAWSEYAELYFTLAFTEYYSGNHGNAFRLWLAAEELGYSTSSSPQIVQHFDSLLIKHPKAGQLYLARAVALYRLAPYKGGGEEEKKVLRRAVADIDEAKRTGLKDYRCEWHRAEILTMLGEQQQAVEAINNAIELNDNNPHCYSLRYQIRQRLGNAKWGNKNDPDILRSKELMKSWMPEKW